MKTIFTVPILPSMRYPRVQKRLGVRELSKASMWPNRIKLASTALILALTGVACAQPVAPLQPIAPQKNRAQAPTESAQPPKVRPAVVTLRAGELPHVRMTADLLYKILAAEIAVQRGAIAAAANTTLEIAQETADPRLAKRAVELYAAMGDVTGALEGAQVWVNSEPQSQEARSTQLALSAAAGQTEGLVTALIVEVNKSQDTTEAMARAIGILKRMPDPAQALQILEQVVAGSQAKSTLPAHMALADVAKAAGNYPRALKEAQAAMALKPSSEDAALRVLDYGVAVDADQAIKTAQVFARAYPKSRQLRLMLAGKLADQGDVQAALTELSLMSEQSPEDFDLLFIRAQLAYRDNRLQQAQRLLEEYVSVQSQRQASMASGATDAGAALADAFTLLARIAQDQGSPDRAVEFLGRIDDPGARYSARLRQASIRAEQGRVDEAIRMIDALQAADEDEQLIGVLTMSQILRQAKRNEQAIERLEKANQALPDSVEIQYELAMLLEQQSRFDEMETYLRAVIALDLGYAHAYNALGYSLADRGVRLGEAYELIARAHQILPEDPYILDSLGWVKFRQGENEMAEQYLRQAYALKPEAEIAAHLGELLWVTGRRAAAREIWAEGLKIDATNASLVKTLKRFGVEP
jgi:tetratricopeptide (TPR) repeat protein